jgi:hypothetical protein
MFFMPGIYFLLTSYLFMRIFKKYRPEIDKEPDYDEIHRKLIEQRKAEAASEEERERVFDDAAGLLIEKQTEAESRKKNKKTRR